MIADPASAGFCAWEGQARAGAQVVNEEVAWAMRLLHTHGADGADAFHEALFGWEAEPFGPPEANPAVWRLAP